MEEYSRIYKIYSNYKTKQIIEKNSKYNSETNYISKEFSRVISK